jgi:hypothetical protein
MPITIPDKSHKLTDEEKRRIKVAHDRIEDILWRRYVDAFSGDQAFFLHECAICFEQGVVNPYDTLISTLELEKMQPDISLVWEALTAIRRKFDPFMGGYKPIADDEKLFKYLRSVVWRMRNKKRKDERHINGHQVFDGCFDTIKNNDLNDIEIDLALRQVVKDMNPERRADIIAVMRKWLFDDIGRDAIATTLDWDRSRVDKVWKFIQRKQIRKKMME